MQEEIGHTAGNLRELTAFWLAPGWCSEYMYAYLATELTPAVLDADEDEFIEVVRVPLVEIPAKIANGEIRDAKSVASLLLAMRILGRLKLSGIGSKPMTAVAEPTVATVTPYRGEFITVRVDTVSLPDGKEAVREIVSHPSSVCIVPVDCQGNALLVRQYRKAVESFLLEAPAGKMAAEENPDDTALRELQEEIGHTANRLQALGSFYVAPGWCTQTMHAYLATDLVPARLDADEDEFIEVVRVPLADIPGKIANGEIRDAKSIAALLLAMRVMGDN